jgi:hypothetical protein
MHRYKLNHEAIETPMSTALKFASMAALPGRSFSFPSQLLEATPDTLQFAVQWLEMNVCKPLLLPLRVTQMTRRDIRKQQRFSC